jgi:hypothetical protein
MFAASKSFANMNSWTEPQELDQPVPRSARMNWKFILATALASGICLGIAILLTAALYRDAHKMEVLKTRGVTTDGSVSKLIIKRSKAAKYYFADYSFKPLVDSGAQVPPYHGTEQVYVGLFNDLRAGLPVPVIYDPSNPDVSALNFGDRVHTTDPFGIMAFELKIALAPLGLALVFILTMIIGRYYKEKYLVQWGNTAPATITDNEEEQIIRGVPKTTAIYRFRDAHGNFVRGARHNLPSANDVQSGYFQGSYRRALARVIDNPTVLYDPRNSDDNLLYPPTFLTCCPPQQKGGKPDRR